MGDVSGEHGLVLDERRRRDHAVLAVDLLAAREELARESPRLPHHRLVGRDNVFRLQDVGDRVALGITTTDVQGGLRIENDHWAVGGLDRPSYVDPRYPAVLSEASVARSVGAVTEAFVDRAVRELAAAVGAD